MHAGAHALRMLCICLCIASVTLHCACYALCYGDFLVHYAVPINVQGVSVADLVKSYQWLEETASKRQR